MIEALDDLMPAAAPWNVPDGGFYVWVDPARRARRQGDAAARGHRPGRLRARARRSSPTASASQSCGCPTATPPPSGSARAYAAWPASSRRSWSCAQTFGASGPSARAAPQGYDAPSTRPELRRRPHVLDRDTGPRGAGRGARRRPVPRARRLAALRPPGRRGAARHRGRGRGARRRRRRCCPRCTADPPACVVPMLHGETGEDGALREVLELLGVPYVGATPDACRVAFDKPVAKTVVARGRAAHPASRSACRTRRSASSARPR